MPSFEELMQGSGVSEYATQPRILEYYVSPYGDVEIMAEEIITELDYMENDPRMVTDYRDFVRRSWRERGVSDKKFALLRQQACSNLGYDEEA